MNSIQLIGRLTKDPELRYTTSNKAVCQFNLAVNRIKQDETDFITCVVWEKQAENLKKYQSKGSLIAVSGSMRVDPYEDKDGNRRYKTYVLANNIEYLSSKSSEEVNNEKPAAMKEESDPFADFGKSIEITDDDLPF